MVQAFDVETAFLNGEGIDRELYVRPPFDLEGVDPHALWKIKKGVFGLSEAPRLWWLRIRKDLLETGWQELPVAPATFVLKDLAGALCGLLVLHVDDGLVCGPGEWHEKALASLKARAPINRWKNW